MNNVTKALIARGFSDAGYKDATDAQGMFYKKVTADSTFVIGVHQVEDMTAFTANLPTTWSTEVDVAFARKINDNTKMLRAVVTDDGLAFLYPFYTGCTHNEGRIAKEFAAELEYALGNIAKVISEYQKEQDAKDKPDDGKAAAAEEAEAARRVIHLVNEVLRTRP